jgi:hypothetical protein
MEAYGDFGRVADLLGERVEKDLLVVAQFVEQHEYVEFVRRARGRHVETFALPGVDISFVPEDGIGFLYGFLRDVEQRRQFVHRRQQMPLGIVAVSYQLFYLFDDLFINRNLTIRVDFNFFRHVCRLKK